jgi:hypothetical protein
LTSRRLFLDILAGRYAVCRLDPSAPLPDWALSQPFFSITRSPQEVSVVSEERHIPAGCRHEGGWRVLRVEGPLDLGATGILASLAAPLAEGGVSLFAISTWETDYLLVREADLAKALAALTGEGHEVRA